MTDDLLGKIFYHLCARGPLSLRHLLFVSRRFHHVAVNNAQLWTVISLDDAFSHHFYQWPEQGDRFVILCLLRSDTLPLCLYITCYSLGPRDCDVLLHPLATFGKPEWRGFQRCTSLVWDATNHVDGMSVTQRFMEVLPKSFPALKHLSLSFFKDPTSASQFPNCPVLERVEILNHHIPYLPRWDTNFLYVSTLSFGNDNSWAGFDLTTLSLFPGLHDLTLFTVYSTTTTTSSFIVPIIFEHLHILRVRGGIPPELLNKLAAPALEELHLEANANDTTSIDALQTSFDPLCLYVHALLPEAVSAREPEWATNLSKLVQRCTRITSLHISRWMEEECEIFLSGQDVVLHVQ